MNVKQLVIGLALSSSLLGACQSIGPDEDADKFPEPFDHSILSEPYDILEGTERKLDSLYQTDDFRVYLNGEEQDLTYTSTLPFVVDNQSDRAIDVGQTINLYHIVDGEAIDLGQQQMDERVTVEADSAKDVSVDLSHWQMDTDATYQLTVEIAGYDEPASLEFFTGSLADELEDE